MRWQLRSIFPLALTVIFPASLLLAENPTAVVQTRGSVTINGKTPAESTNLFNGDRIQTSGRDSAASILASGMHVTVMGNSTVIYADNNVTVDCGGVLVSSKGQAAHINGVTVTPSPAGGSAKFEFRQSRGSYQITSREGSVAFDDGTGEKILGLNQTASHAGGGEACNREVAAADPPQNPPPVQGGMSAGGGGLSEGTVSALGVGSAFVAVCAIECRSHHHHKSPKNP